VKILYICKDFTNWIGHGHLAFKQALAKITDVTFYHKSCDIVELLSKFKSEGKTFDVVMLGEAPPVTPPVQNLSAISIPKVVHYWDVHVLHHERLLFIRENKIDLVIVKYKCGTKEQFPQLLQTVPCAWLPIGVDTTIFKNYKLAKSINILLTGALIESVYPLRHQYLKTFSGYPGFVHLPHPGYKEFEPGSAITGVDYAKLLNTARVCPTCSSIYKYPIQKHFEIPSSYSLLAAPFFEDLDELGYKPDVNFLDVNFSNFERKIKRILNDEDRLKEVTRAGYLFVRRHHSVSIRAKQFINLLSQRLFSQRAPYPNLQSFTL